MCSNACDNWDRLCSNASMYDGVHMLSPLWEKMKLLCRSWTHLTFLSWIYIPSPPPSLLSVLNWRRDNDDKLGLYQLESVTTTRATSTFDVGNWLNFECWCGGGEVVTVFVLHQHSSAGSLWIPGPRPVLRGSWESIKHCYLTVCWVYMPEFMW